MPPKYRSDSARTKLSTVTGTLAAVDCAEATPVQASEPSRALRTSPDFIADTPVRIDPASKLELSLRLHFPGSAKDTCDIVATSVMAEISNFLHLLTPHFSGGNTVFQFLFMSTTAQLRADASSSALSSLPIFDCLSRRIRAPHRCDGRSRDALTLLPAVIHCSTCRSAIGEPARSRCIRYLIPRCWSCCSIIWFTPPRILSMLRPAPALALLSLMSSSVSSRMWPAQSSAGTSAAGNP